MKQIERKNEPKKAFTLAHAPKPEIADKDNTSPKPKPPEHFHQPRLAPAGMMGVRPSRTFQPIVSNENDKSRGWER